MATSKKGGAQEGEVNCVGDNAIWRQQINFELRTAAHWEENWGFMKGGNYKTAEEVAQAEGKKAKEAANKPPATSIFPSKLPAGLIDSEKDEILQSYLYTYNIPKVINYRTPMEKYHMPTSTTQEIGWKWKSPAGDTSEKFPNKFYTLEKFGRTARGQGDVFKWWGGCKESLP